MVEEDAIVKRVHPTFYQLIALEAFSDAGSYYGAAKALGVRSITIREHVEALEKNVGRTLVEPGSYDRPVKFTKDGHALADRLVNVMSAARTARLVPPKRGQR